MTPFWVASRLLHFTTLKTADRELPCLSFNRLCYQAISFQFRTMLKSWRSLSWSKRLSILIKKKFYHSVHTNCPLDLLLSYFEPLTPFPLRFTLILSFCLCLNLARFCSLRVSTKILYAFLCFPGALHFPTHHIFRDLLTPMLFGKTKSSLSVIYSILLLFLSLRSNY